MEKQLEGLAELLDGGLEERDSERQMKELYDCLAEEDRLKEEEYKNLKKEISEITAVLDAFNVAPGNSVSVRLKNCLKKLFP